jgi:hypothetical protein
MSIMPIGDMGGQFSMGGGAQMAGGPAGQPILGSGGGIAGQTQDQIANPIYGGNSPFQPPPVYDEMPNAFGGLGKSMGMLPFIPGPMGQAGAQFLGGPGQLTGGPAGQPILGGNPLAGFGASGGQLVGGPVGQPILGGTPMQGPGQLAGGPAPISNKTGPLGSRPSTDNLLTGAPMTTQAQVPQSTYGRMSNNKPSQPLYRGGLRQPPNNYRPPMYSNTRRFLGR